MSPEMIAHWMVVFRIMGPFEGMVVAVCVITVVVLAIRAIRGG